MDGLFASRMSSIQKSFIREILKVTRDPQVISFAGGLPNPDFFPTAEIAAAAAKVLAQSGPEALQYSTSEGYLPLREAIARRYLARHGLNIPPEQILITNGSQQGLDLIGKILLDRGDRVILERPGYLGAIQALSMYQPALHAVPLRDDGVDLEQLEQTLRAGPGKLFYTAPNFQNPSGTTYARGTREAVADLLSQYGVMLVEDDPYGELRFAGENLPPIRTYAGERAVLLGTFSKIVAPGLRLGWICAGETVMGKLLVAKQAADLHSNYLAQRIVYQYLQDNDLDRHIARIRETYQAQRDLMVSMIKTHFPPEVSFVQPEGGMFLWLTLPEGVSSMALFETAARVKVAFVPGHPFYIDGGGQDTLRLNFSNSDAGRITAGMTRLAEALQAARADRKPVSG